MFCQEPPSDVCADATTRRTFEDVGLCNDSTGECEYEATDLSCEYGCDDGLCSPDPSTDSVFGYWGHRFTGRGCRCRPGVPRLFYSADLTTIGDGTAFLAFYDLDADRAHWAASRDGERWSRGVLPALYDNTIAGGNGLVAVARRPDGGLGFFVSPTDPGMGDAALIEMR